MKSLSKIRAYKIQYITTMTKSVENLAVGARIEKEQATSKLYILTIFLVPCRANSIISVCHISIQLTMRQILENIEDYVKLNRFSVF